MGQRYLGTGLGAATTAASALAALQAAATLPAATITLSGGGYQATVNGTTAAVTPLTDPSGLGFNFYTDGSSVVVANPSIGWTVTPTTSTIAGFLLTSAQFATLTGSASGGAGSPPAWAYDPESAPLAGAVGWLMVIVQALPNFTVTWGGSGAATDQVVITVGTASPQEFLSGAGGGSQTGNWLSATTLFSLVPVDASGNQYPAVDAISVNAAPGIYAGANVSATQIAAAQAANPTLSVYQATESAGVIDPSLYVSASTAASAAAAAASSSSSWWTSLTNWFTANPTEGLLVAGVGVFAAVKLFGKK
jgi:hypothetical protein